jgi:hypothetical protein
MSCVGLYCRYLELVVVVCVVKTVHFHPFFCVWPMVVFGFVLVIVHLLYATPIQFLFGEVYAHIFLYYNRHVSVHCDRMMCHDGLVLFS